MATSSGNSSGSRSTRLQNSGSEEDLQQVMDQRKRKRMESNRESAKRSRMRKQKHLDDLKVQVSNLWKENSEIVTTINVTNQRFLNVESENSILRVRMMELSQRLQSLNEIFGGVLENDREENHQMINNFNSHDSFTSPWNLLYVNQPVMASSAYAFQY